MPQRGPSSSAERPASPQEPAGRRRSQGRSIRSLDGLPPDTTNRRTRTSPRRAVRRAVVPVHRLAQRYDEPSYRYIASPTGTTSRPTGTSLRPNGATSRRTGTSPRPAVRRATYRYIASPERYDEPSYRYIASPEQCDEPSYRYIASPNGTTSCRTGTSGRTGRRPSSRQSG